jgi:hypothetical protein
MDFREFVIACYNYCSFEKQGLILFAYELYDADHNGSMSVPECKSMFMEVYGADFGAAEKGFKLFEKLEKLATEDEKTFDIITKKREQASARTKRAQRAAPPSTARERKRKAGGDGATMVLFLVAPRPPPPSNPFSEFIDLVNTHVNVLMPAYHIQNAIQSKIMGKRVWTKVRGK